MLANRDNARSSLYVQLTVCIRLITVKVDFVLTGKNQIGNEGASPKLGARPRCLPESRHWLPTSTRRLMF